MKKLWVLFLFIPFLASAQLEFESYIGKLDFVELPEIKEVVSNPFLAGKPTRTDNTLRKLPSFRLSKDNFREPVSVFDAMAASETYVKSTLEVKIDPREYSVYGGNNGNSKYTPDTSTKVTNSVYKDASHGFYFIDTCPPNRFCPRCAPYRFGRY